MNYGSGYRIVTGLTEQMLANEVERLLADGWKPVGGVAEYRGALIQAMWWEPKL